MDVLVTRYIGIYGTAILAKEHKDELSQRYPEWFVTEATRFMDGINPDVELPEISIANNFGAVYAAEYREFGIFEALYCMSRALNTGLRISIKDIPIKQETVEVCECLGVNPYALYAGYSSVIVCENGEALCALLEENDIPVRIVGCTASDNDKKIINEDEEGFLPHIRKDELKNKLGRRVYYERTDFSHLRKE